MKNNFVSLHLPFTKGDTLWAIKDFDGDSPKAVPGMIVDYVESNDAGIYAYGHFKDGTTARVIIITWKYGRTSFGKTAFLSKEDAEEHIAYLKDGASDA